MKWVIVASSFRVKTETWILLCCQDPNIIYLWGLWARFYNIEPDDKPIYLSAGSMFIIQPFDSWPLNRRENWKNLFILCSFVNFFLLKYFYRRVFQKFIIYSWTLFNTHVFWKRHVMYNQKNFPVPTNCYPEKVMKKSNYVNV